MKPEAPVIILHFSPVELYPPVMNLLNYVSGKGTAREWIVISTSLKETDISPFNARGISILRRGRSGPRLSRLGRVLGYLSFYMAACILILRKKPGVVLYFETLSCLPAYVCRSFFRRKSKLMAHYHEYVTPEEYDRNSAFFRYLHRKERQILPMASWISQTNAERLELFKRDMKIQDSSICRVLPNYPPAEWKMNKLKEYISFPIKVVYVGALSGDTMYLKEFAEWVKKQDGKVCWDIYSLQPDDSVLNYLVSLSTPHIRWRGSVAYGSMPSVMRGYDVGVILYKGHIPNYIHNAPNKLFEYHVNGLDVWFPRVMLGTCPYITTGTYPKILSLDFENLDAVDPSQLTERKGLKLKMNEYSCENVLSLLYNELENS